MVSDGETDGKKAEHYQMQNIMHVRSMEEVPFLYE